MPGLKLLIAAIPLSRRSRPLFERLLATGFEPVEAPGPEVTDWPEFWPSLAEAQAILMGHSPRIDEALLQKAPRLKFVAKLGAGLDRIDLAAASRQGVAVFNTPAANRQAVADHTLALILALARRITISDQIVRAGRWRRLQGLQVWGKRLGVVGLGAIGRAVVRRARGFDMDCAAFTRTWPSDFAREHGVRRLDLDELLAASDVVSLHLPLTPETRGLIGARELGLMKPSALLINTARGGLIDEAALYEALTEGQIAGAGLDVFEREPPRDSPLLGLENVILTPHEAWYTAEALARMEEEAVDQLIAAAQGLMPRHLANPEVAGRLGLEPQPPDKITS